MRGADIEIACSVHRKLVDGALLRGSSAIAVFAAAFRLQNTRRARPDSRLAHIQDDDVAVTGSIRALVAHSAVVVVPSALPEQPAIGYAILGDQDAPGGQACLALVHSRRRRRRGCVGRGCGELFAPRPTQLAPPAHGAVGRIQDDEAVRKPACSASPASPRSRRRRRCCRPSRWQLRWPCHRPSFRTGGASAPRRRLYRR